MLVEPNESNASGARVQREPTIGISSENKTHILDVVAAEPVCAHKP